MLSHYFWRQRCCDGQRWLHYLIVVLLLLSTFTQSLYAQAEQPTPTPVAAPVVEPTTTPTLAQLEEQQLEQQIESIVKTMSPADKVGQLFIITFVGNDTSAQSDIAELLHTYRVGGVVLTPRYLNFSNAKGTDTARQVATLTNQLQSLAYGIQLPAAKAFAPLPSQLDQPWPPASLTALTQTVPTPVYLPLFIGVEQAGDDLPQTALRNGFTPLPSQMALGATWNAELTRQIGEIVGRELHAIGINLLLGPTLDVVDNPRADEIGSLGINSFGGDPYWVSKLGQAYITGVHQGGHGHVATIARHFPGQGDVDRLPDQEVATVQKSLEELRRVSLAPFRTVTQDSSLILRNDGDPGATEGLMTSHMRYSNLPGGATPFSLGPDLSKTMEQEGFAAWHNRGGILMSNAVGVRAIRRHYDPTEQTFQRRQVAVDLFNAGHDLIYLDEVGQGRSDLSPAEDWPVAKEAIIKVIQLFQERYTNGSDPSFVRSVDEAVRRILRLKLRLYGQTFLAYPAATTNTIISATLPTTSTAPLTATFSLTQPVIPLNEVLATEAGLEALSQKNLETNRAVVGQVASEAVAVLKPNNQALTDVLPEAPRAEDNILIFSDSRLLFECEPGCTAEAALGPDDIANIITEIYGEAGTGQITPDRIKSRTLGELGQWLGPPETEVTVAGVTTATLPAASNEVTVTNDLAVTLEGADKALDPRGLVASSVLTQEISAASWIIFTILDVQPGQPSSIEVVKRFLGGARSRQLADKKVIILALNAPYFLGATEVSRATAYFGIFSKTPPFVESAVRALFRGYPPTGAPPVSVPGTEFASLVDRLEPNAAQKLALQVFVKGTDTPLAFNSESPPQVQSGEVLRLVVGPVQDLNGRPVPDGTPVNFVLTYEGDPSMLSIEPVSTHDGQGVREITLERAGLLQLTINAGAATSEPLTLVVLPDPTQITPTPAPTVALTANSGQTETKPISATNVISANQNNTSPPPEVSQRPVDLITLAVSLFTILITLSLLLIAQIQILPRQILVHNMLWATIFGLAAYILYGLGLLPGSSMLRERLETFGPALVVFIAMLLPLLWLQLRTEQNQ